jgi:hypothetical protein
LYDQISRKKDVSGIAGLGWDLEIGDAVARTLRGISDEHLGKQGIGYSSRNNDTNDGDNLSMLANNPLELICFYSLKEGAPLPITAVDPISFLR